MRRMIVIAATAATLGLGLTAPALAANGTTPGTCDGSGVPAGTSAGPQAGRGSGAGMGRGAHLGRPGRGQGAGGMGSGGRGTGQHQSTVALSAEQSATLVSMANEEKMAGDLYAVFADRYGDAELAAIATSEDRHLAAVRRVMARHGVADPTAGLGAGEFSTAAFTQSYADLLARGEQSLTQAYSVGADVERADIADLDAAIAQAAGVVDLTRVYTNLRAASLRHLAAFTS